MQSNYNREVAEKEFLETGERWFMEHLSWKLNTIFDVGSNMGEWTHMSREFNPNAEIHTFEIMPRTFKKLLNNIDLNNVIPNGFGLADYNGVLPMKYIESFDAMSTHVGRMHNDNFVWKDGLVIKGDDYIKSKEIEYVDFLKIDTEGAEDKVLDGLIESIKQQKIGIIQFEYGFINVLTKWLLVDYYELLRPLGYNIGKLTPDGIKFKEYELTDEDFKGPNYVAVHHSKMDLI